VKEQENGQGNDSHTHPPEGHKNGAMLNPRKGQDARAEIRVSEDGMEVVADFYPPRGSGEPLSRQWLFEQLAAFDVVKGHDEEAISKALEVCNLERKNALGVKVAAGKQPVDETPERIELDKKFTESGPKLDRDALRVDFREVSAFVMVRKDETIGRLLPDQPGEEGYDVRGTAKPFGKKQGNTYELGDKVKQVGDQIRADADGRFVSSGKRIWVEEVLEVKEKVNYHTGNLSFPGNILIGGGIEPGFKVYSGASIICKSTIDATDVNAKKDLIVQGGIVGRPPARVRVGGRLEARFVENCRVAVREDALVASAVLNSHLYTLGKFLMGDKGRISGGEIWAMRGLKASTLGSPNGLPLSVTCGVDFTVKQQVDFIKERLRILVAKSLRAEGLARIKTSTALEAIRLEISAMQEQLLASLNELEPTMDACPDATVEVKGEVFPGVTIAICRCSMTVAETLKAMRFTADHSRGHIVCENLK
jgi:uncharacterized protein